MGSTFKTTREWENIVAAQEKDREDRVTAIRMTLAKKIVLAVVDKISSDIIRPGPKPEERECYVMAEELRSLSPELAALVSAVLKIEEEER